SADGVEVEVGDHVEHDATDERRGLTVEGDAAQVDVVVGLRAGGEGDPSVDDGLVLDDLEQAGAVGGDVSHEGQSPTRGREPPVHATHPFRASTTSTWWAPEHENPHFSGL